VSQSSFPIFPSLRDKWDFVALIKHSAPQARLDENPDEYRGVRSQQAVAPRQRQNRSYTIKNEPKPRSRVSGRAQRAGDTKSRHGGDGWQPGAKDGEWDTPRDGVEVMS